MPRIVALWNDSDVYGKMAIAGGVVLGIKSAIVDTGCGILAGAAVDHFIKDMNVTPFERFAIDAAAGAAGSFIGHFLTKYDEEDMVNGIESMRYMFGNDKEEENAGDTE